MITLRVYSKEVADRLEAALSTYELLTTDLGSYTGQGQVYEVTLLPPIAPQYVPRGPVEKYQFNPPISRYANPPSEDNTDVSA